MNNQEFRTLASKYAAGTANTEEAAAFEAAYALLEDRHAIWDERLLGDETEFKKEMYADALDRIARKERFLASRSLLKMAAAILVFITVGFSAWHFRTMLRYRLDPVSQLSATTHGEIKQITLADGSRVWLNSASTLDYPDKFRDGSRREVRLTGEAYFEVVHEKDSPFIIHTGNIHTTVLGTTFNVKAYRQEKEIAVTVLSGKVGVFKSTGGMNTAQFVEAAQQLTYHKETDGFTRNNSVDGQQTIGWREGKLSFEHATLSEVVAQLERRYTVRIGYAKELSGCPVYADFNNEPIDKVLDILSVSLRGKALQRTDGYYLTGKGCR